MKCKFSNNLRPQSPAAYEAEADTHVILFFSVNGIKHCINGFMVAAFDTLHI